ncbi:unnamed protein product [Discula destructiva]
MASAGTLSATASALSSPAVAAASAPVAPAASHHQAQQNKHQRASNIVASQASGPVAASQEPLVRSDCSSVTSSPPQLPAELTSSIPEESDEDSATVASHNEPLTPVSGRQSSEFPAVQTRDSSNDNTSHPFSAIPAEDSKATLDLRQGPFSNNFDFAAQTAPAQSQQQPQQQQQQGKPTSTDTISPLTAISHTSTEAPARLDTQDRRPSTRASTASTFKLTRTITNMFTRKNSTQPDEPSPVLVAAQSYYGDAPERRWSMARSSANTPQHTSPPSPSSPSENGETRPRNTKFLAAQEPGDTLTKKDRASTGFNLRSRAVNFATGRNQKKTKRASSFDGNDKKPAISNALPMENFNRQVFQMIPDQGVGVKARRLSLSLPDDFQVDVGDLSKEFENQHKLFGRHRDGLGKGATARVRVMAKKGFPNELYAVKEFRGKMSPETKEEYEKKVKSEFSIAKSLHHPNIVETVRLCVDHGRWNHVMEYCSEGDLYSLIKKGHLMKEERKPDRFCLFKQLLQGLGYLHANGIAHRDVKLENLLITKDSKLKITDFGVSEVFSGIHPGTRESGGECGKKMGDIRLCDPGICGSEPYIAPEVLDKKNKYDPRGLDVWGAGIVLISLMCRGPLWDAARDLPSNPNYTALLKSFDRWNAKHPEGNAVFTESDYPAYHIFDEYLNPPPLRRVLFMMLNPNPDKRASLDQVLSHRWVKNIECCQLESYDDPVVVIDATKKMSLNSKGTKKIYCHNHLPPPPATSHSLGKMPGQPGY